MQFEKVEVTESKPVTSTQYKCPKCTKTDGGIYSIQAHYAKYHIVKEIFKCNRILVYKFESQEDAAEYAALVNRRFKGPSNDLCWVDLYNEGDDSCELVPLAGYISFLQEELESQKQQIEALEQLLPPV